ncbi:hypothetical protein M8J77_023760 [Diaphorina citri]|nr:hypothetical protein M8J77_023760 [Diaphorina citri]
MGDTDVNTFSRISPNVTARKLKHANRHHSFASTVGGFTCGTKSGLTSHLRHRHRDMAAPGLRPLKLRPSSAATPAPPQSAPPPPVPSSTAAAGPSGFICNRRGRVCKSKAGLVSHSKACLR